jgi:hypothetical protein
VIAEDGLDEVYDAGVSSLRRSARSVARSGRVR